MNELVEKLLQPVSAAEPCGPDLAYDPAFDELASLAKGKPEVEMGEVKKPAEPPEWRELRTKSAEFLGRSKHLQIVMMYVCSLLTTEGVAGLRDGLQLVRGLLEKYWVELYPRLDPEDNNDPMQRLNILGALNAVGGPFSGWVTVIDNLYAAEICRAKGMPPLTFRQFLDAKAKAPGALDLSKLSAAIRTVGAESIVVKRQALAEALEATQGIDQFLTTTLGAGGTISFEVLEKALQELIKELTPFCGDAAEAEVGAEGAASTEGGETAGSGIVVSGSIRSRDDVVRTLESICSYYAQVEPSSPVPLLLKRVQKLVKMNFIETMHELSLATLESLRPSMGSVVDSSAAPGTSRPGTAGGILIMSLPAVPMDCPLRLGSPAEFAALRTFFQQAQFDDSTLCRVLKIGGMTDYGRVRWEEIQLDSLSPPLRWCLDIFARGLPAGESESRTLCGEAVFAALYAVGLLRPAKKNPGTVLCPVWVYPVAGFVLASDRREDPEGDPFNPPADVVFPAIYPGTLRFLQLIPEARSGDALDLCGGSGIGALRLAGTARVAVTADLTERSAFFAEFNGRLNGVAIESLCGDLYTPVSGRRFDWICAHPPFVPSTGETMVYRDGGETGETVTRRIIEGLPGHLCPGGTAVVLCVACDTGTQTFEQRAREWLGGAGDEFDLVFGLEKVLSVAEVVESMRKRGQQIGDEAARQLQVRLRAADTRQFVYGALFVRRYAARVGDAPIRVHLTSEGRAADFEHLLGWRHFRRQPDFAGWLAGARPQPALRLLLTARHVVQDGELVPAEFVFSIEAGFSAALKPDSWVVPLVARLNGRRTVQEVFETARRADELPDGFTLEAFLGLVQRMIEMGLLVAPEGTNSAARPSAPRLNAVRK